MQDDLNRHHTGEPCPELEIILRQSDESGIHPDHLQTLLEALGDD